MVRIPRNEGIESYAELWARAIQRGYRFPGVAASIRNSLARSSLTRLKTNSVGEANLDNLKSGSYYVVGASTLGQVGVVWSKPRYSPKRRKYCETRSQRCGLGRVND